MPQQSIRHAIFFPIVRRDMASGRIDSDQDALQNGSTKVKTHSVSRIKGGAQLFIGGLQVTIRHSGKFHQLLVGHSEFVLIVTHNVCPFL
jgi:hypothetical protein